MSRKKPHAAPERKTVEVEVECDTERLYGSIEDAITYLLEMRQLHGHETGFGLQEKWTGYEDMHMAFTYSRIETDEEYDERLREEERERKWEEAQKLKEKERERDREEYERLRRRHGFQ